MKSSRLERTGDNKTLSPSPPSPPLPPSPPSAGTGDSAAEASVSFFFRTDSAMSKARSRRSSSSDNFLNPPAALSMLGWGSKQGTTGFPCRPIRSTRCHASSSRTRSSVPRSRSRVIWEILASSAVSALCTALSVFFAVAVRSLSTSFPCSFFASGSLPHSMLSSKAFFARSTSVCSAGSFAVRISEMSSTTFRTFCRPTSIPAAVG
mmetsp:Transcript_69309/g.139413  ORF Transcript_69309/g.139413 Transcript_69309/m.139413 type:complete len:207 (+) Transcript_69309:517-1137(+)